MDAAKQEATAANERAENEAKARIKAENAKAQSDARIAKLEAIIEELKNKNNQHITLNKASYVIAICNYHKKPMLFNKA